MQSLELEFRIWMCVRAGETECTTRLSSLRYIERVVEKPTETGSEYVGAMDRNRIGGWKNLPEFLGRKKKPVDVGAPSEDIWPGFTSLPKVPRESVERPLDIR